VIGPPTGKISFIAISVISFPYEFGLAVTLSV